MAKHWWQFKHWPDEENPNEIEEWPAGAAPNPCTVFRTAWLNQFIGWARYVSLDRMIDSSRGSISAGHNIQTPDFWNNRLRPSLSSGRYVYKTFSNAPYQAGTTFDGIELVPEYKTIQAGNIIHPGATGDQLIEFLCTARAEIDKIGSVLVLEYSSNTYNRFDFRRRGYFYDYDDHLFFIDEDYGGDCLELHIYSDEQGSHFTNIYLHSVDLFSSDFPEVRGQRLAVVSVKKDSPYASPDSEAPSAFPMPVGQGICHAIKDIASNASRVSWTCDAGYVADTPSGNEGDWYRKPLIVVVIKDDLPTAYRMNWPEGYNNIQWPS